MPIQYPNFNADPQSVPKINGLPGVVDSVQKGYAMALLPEKMRQDAALRQAKLTQTQQQNEYYPAQQEAMNAYRDAQAQKLQQDANNPGLKFSGDVRNAYQLQRLKEMAAKDPSLQPYYESAQEAYSNKEAAQKSLIDYRGVLTDTADKRYSSPLAKLYAEMADVRDGFRPGTGRTDRLTPEEQDKLTNQYNLDIQKKTTDADLRKRVMFAGNIEKSLESIDPKILTQYSGIKGGAELERQKALSQFGKQSPEYDAYLNSVQAAALTAFQASQFWGKSIDYREQENLRALANPSTWDKNPTQALNQFKTTMKIIGKETNNYKAGLQSTAPYTTPSTIGQEQPSPQYAPQGQTPPQNTNPYGASQLDETPQYAPQPQQAPAMQQAPQGQMPPQQQQAALAAAGQMSMEELQRIAQGGR